MQSEFARIDTFFVIFYFYTFVLMVLIFLAFPNVLRDTLNISQDTLHTVLFCNLLIFRMKDIYIYISRITCENDMLNYCSIIKKIRTIFFVRKIAIVAFVFVSFFGSKILYHCPFSQHFTIAHVSATWCGKTVLPYKGLSA